MLEYDIRENCVFINILKILTSTLSVMREGIEIKFYLNLQF